MSRGGKRAGAGRPAPAGERISISARVSQETEKKLRHLADTEGGMGRAIDKLASNYQL